MVQTGFLYIILRSAHTVYLCVLCGSENKKTQFTFFYSKTNKMHNISNLFYFGTTFYMFQTVFPSIIRSLRLYIQHRNIQVLWLLASKQLQNLYGTMLYVQY